jgi:hypothetical protein
MKPAVKRTFDRRGARAKAQSSPPCSFIRLITPWIAEQFHHLKLTLKLSRQWGAPQSLPSVSITSANIVKTGRITKKATKLITNPQPQTKLLYL